MNWESKYTDLQRIMSADGKPLFGKTSIKNLKKLSEKNRSMYLTYFDNLKETGKITSSFQTYRATHLDFLKYISDLECELVDISQSIVDSYFQSLSVKNKGQSKINGAVAHLKTLFLFFGITEIDLDQYATKVDISKSKMPRIEAEKISQAKDVYRTIRTNSIRDSREYINATKKLFVLEMFLYTPLSEEFVGEFHRKKGAFDERGIYFRGKNHLVPTSLINLIKEMREAGPAYETLDMKTAVDSMKVELSEYNMENLSSKGAETTTEAIFWTCPQCGNLYEAIAENWCVKQYTENGENWVVCREICGHE